MYRFFSSFVFASLLGLLFQQNAMALPVPDPLTALENQPYALCAGAISFNFNGITYAKCRKKDGDSLGITHSYPVRNNIQTVNDIGALDTNPFIVSTYSPPDNEVYALYSCNKSGAYAQCDGGICFTNTSATTFPGVGFVAENEIICSCPISTANRYHVWGPADCPKTAQAYDNICGAGSKKEVIKDGVILRIGNSGSVKVTKAQNDLYYQKFGGTPSEIAECRRPDH